MPRRARLYFPGHPLHIVHRGVNRGACFTDHADHAMYLGLLNELAEGSGCLIHAYVLMSNHVHLLITPEVDGACAALMKPLAQRYAQRFNKRRSRSGPLWEGRYKSNLVDSQTYALRCYRYIEANPVRARMVGHPADYPWSSHRANAFGAPVPFITPHPAFESLDADEQARRLAYRGVFDEPLSDLELTRIRNGTRTGLAVGFDEFIENVSIALGWRPVGRNGRVA